MLSLDLDTAHHVGIKWTQFLKAETHKDSDAFSDETRVDRWTDLSKTRRIISVE